MSEAVVHEVAALPFETRGETTEAELLAMAQKEEGTFVEQEDEEGADEADHPETESGEAEPEGDAESGQPDDEADQPEPIAFEIDGEKVTLDELREWKRGALREADYTKKTQAVAEERKALEAERAAERQQYAEALEKMSAFLASTQPAEPDHALRDTDPAEYAAQWADYQAAIQDRAAVAAEQQRLAAEKQAEAEKQMKEYAETERQRLLDAVPEWKDATVRTAEGEKLLGYAKSLGYSDADFGMVTDHRLLLMLRDASRYREIVAKGKEVVEEKKKTAVLTPGSRDNSPKRPSDERRKIINKAIRPGASHDAVMAAFMALPPD